MGLKEISALTDIGTNLFEHSKHGNSEAEAKAKAKALADPSLP